MVDLGQNWESIRPLERPNRLGSTFTEGVNGLTPLLEKDNYRI